MKLYIKSIVILFTILTTNNLFAQKQGQAIIDSLLKALPAAIDDTNKVILYTNLSDYCSNYSIDSGVLFGEKANALATRLNWLPGIADANYFLGFNYYNKSDYPDALEYLLKALKAYETTANQNGIANTTRKIGNVYRDLKNYSKALDCYFKALKILEKENDKLTIGKCYSNIGEIYGLEYNSAKAMEYYKKAIKVDEDDGYLNGLVITYLRVGDVYNNDKNYTEGLNYKLKGLTIAVKNYDKNIIAKEQLEEAYGGVGKCYLSIAKNNLKDKIPPKKDTALQNAVFYLTRAIELVKNMGEQVDLQSYYADLSEAEALAGSFKSAYENLNLSYQLQDTLFSAKSNIKITGLETQREKELKEQVAKLENTKKRNETMVIIAGFVTLLIIIGIVFRNNKLISLEKKKSDHLLLNILPSEVAEELKNKGSAKARYFDNVTVLFTDFVNFTSTSEKMIPQALIDELHTCFKAFDEITAKYNVEKIKTIGDAYLAVAGLPTADPLHAEHIVRAALEINAFMQARFAKLGNRTFEIRIGIHSGSVVAGIVGVKKFAYDIWGDTVNTAARMEQNSSAGKINISATTYELVKNKFTCEYRGEIDAKGKGMLKMYYVG